MFAGGETRAVLLSVCCHAHLPSDVKWKLPAIAVAEESEINNARGCSKMEGLDTREGSSSKTQILIKLDSLGLPPLLRLLFLVQGHLQRKQRRPAKTCK